MFLAWFQYTLKFLGMRPHCKLRKDCNRFCSNSIRNGSLSATRITNGNATCGARAANAAHLYLTLFVIVTFVQILSIDTNIWLLHMASRYYTWAFSCRSISFYYKLPFYSLFFILQFRCSINIFGNDWDDSLYHIWTQFQSHQGDSANDLS